MEIYDFTCGIMTQIIYIYICTSIYMHIDTIYICTYYCRFILRISNISVISNPGKKLKALAEPGFTTPRLPPIGRGAAVDSPPLPASVPPSAPNEAHLELMAAHRELLKMLQNHTKPGVRRDF
jgi:hypothetical protein